MNYATFLSYIPLLGVIMRQMVAEMLICDTKIPVVCTPLACANYGYFLWIFRACAGREIECVVHRVLRASDIYSNLGAV